MLQLNDTHNTHIDLSKRNLTSLKFRGYLEIMVTFRLEDVEVETAFTYDSTQKARDDFEMLIDMISDEPTLLTEES
tara:strand:+ start:272 stop:499 length:228 start_codon:yes stop_codon:yes gene_type:complete